MNEQTEPNVVNSDIDAQFEANVSLNNIVGNAHAVAIAKNYVDSFYNDVADGRNPQLASILLIGQTGLTTFARAISNSFGNTHFKLNHASWFNGSAQEMNCFYYYGSFGMTFFIGQIDSLNLVSQYTLWNILLKKRLHVLDLQNQIPINAPLRNSLYIFSAKNIDKLTEPLFAKLPVRISIGRLTRDELFAALKQRASLLGLTCSSDSVLMSIAKVSGNIDEAIELFGWSHRVQRANNETVLTDAHVNRAFRLMDANLKAANNKLP